MLFRMLKDQSLSNAQTKTINTSLSSSDCGEEVKLVKIQPCALLLKKINLGRLRPANSAAHLRIYCIDTVYQILLDFYIIDYLLSGSFN